MIHLILNTSYNVIVLQYINNIVNVRFMLFSLFLNNIFKY